LGIVKLNAKCSVASNRRNLPSKPERLIPVTVKHLIGVRATRGDILARGHPHVIINSKFKRITVLRPASLAFIRTMAYASDVILRQPPARPAQVTVRKKIGDRRTVIPNLD
jgi:hypothetical protein